MTPGMQRALQALLTERTKQEAAAAAGISPRTLRTYLANKEFLREYQRAFRSLVNDATRQAQQALSPAVAALRTIVEDPEESASSRIAAARSLLEYGLRFTEFSDILRELDAMDATEGDA